MVGEAANGEEALQLARTLNPDLITMDVAMPVMDGIAAVRHIMDERPTRIIMFSALTQEGAKSTLEALDAGAVDFLPKISSREQMGSSAAQLRERVLAIAASGPAEARPAGARPAPVPPQRSAPSVARPTRRRNGRGGLRLLVIGASTGGPMAVQKVLAGLPADFPVPVLVVIHMPGSFTATYAERLDGLSPLRVSEAKDGARLEVGSVLVAPGGFQTRVVQEPEGLAVRVSKGGADQLYHPSVDVTLASASQALGGDAMGVVLTGMGSDGANGAAALARSGGTVWAQDRDSCVVYGMPRAVAEAGVAERILPLDDIAAQLVEVA